MIKFLCAFIQMKIDEKKIYVLCVLHVFFLDF